MLILWNTFIYLLSILNHGSIYPTLLLYILHVKLNTELKATNYVHQVN